MLVQTPKHSFVQLKKDRFKLKLNAYILTCIGLRMYFTLNFTCAEVFQPVNCSSMFGACFLLPKYLIVLWWFLCFTCQLVLPQKLVWLRKHDILTGKLYMLVNFLFYRSFLLSAWKRRRSQETSDMYWDINARKYKSFDFGRNMHEQNLHGIWLCFAQICWTLLCLPPWFSIFGLQFQFSQPMG